MTLQRSDNSILKSETPVLVESVAFVIYDINFSLPHKANKQNITRQFFLYIYHQTKNGLRMFFFVSFHLHLRLFIHTKQYRTKFLSIERWASYIFHI